MSQRAISPARKISSNDHISEPILIVIGASAGGVEALRQLVSALPADLPAAVVVTVHISSLTPSRLPDILGRSGALPAAHPADGEVFRAGHIYVAPPDRHLLVEGGRVRLSQGPKENNHRPAIDPLFQSAARAHGARVVGVILSGTMDDGVLGLRMIKNHGGMAVVQDPADALYPQMPQSAIAHVDVDHVLPISTMAAKLVELVQVVQRIADTSEQEAHAMPHNGDKTIDRTINEVEQEIVAQDQAAIEQGEGSGKSTVFTCPNCGGVLWELEENGILRYRCHVGHVYSVESMQEAHADSLEVALWTAYRALKDSAALSRRMGNRSRDGGHATRAERFDARAEEEERRAALVRRALESSPRVGVFETNGESMDPDGLKIDLLSRQTGGVGGGQ